MLGRASVKIEIFKHTAIWTKIPGTQVLLPGSTDVVIPYPTYYVVKSLTTGEERKVLLETSGPVDDFCARADVETGEVSIEGRTRKGFFRELVQKKSTAKKPRLSFGSHKGLNLPQVLDRESMIELVPLLFAASYGYPQGIERTPSLLKDFQDETDRLKLFGHLRDILRAGFTGVFAPHQNDFWGYEHKVSNLAPVEFLGTLSASIQSLFLEESNNTLVVLPKLPIEAASGRFIDIPTSFGIVHLEWTKKKLRRLFIEAKINHELRLVLPQGLSRFRVRTSKADKGRVYSCDVPLILEKGNPYYLDQFES